MGRKGSKGERKGERETTFFLHINVTLGKLWSARLMRIREARGNREITKESEKEKQDCRNFELSLGDVNEMKEMKVKK